MKTSYLRHQYEILGEDGQSFAEFVSGEIERSEQTARDALANAPRNHQGKPLIYTVLRHITPSGMTRSISVHTFDLEIEEMLQLNYPCALLLGLALDKNSEGIKIRGGGMDMGFAMIYDLAGRVLGDGYALSHRWL